MNVVRRRLGLLGREHPIAVGVADLALVAVDPDERPNSGDGGGHDATSVDSGWVASQRFDGRDEPAPTGALAGADGLADVRRHRQLPEAPRLGGGEDHHRSVRTADHAGEALRVDDERNDVVGADGRLGGGVEFGEVKHHPDRAHGSEGSSTNAKGMQDPVYEAAFNQCGESAAGVLDIRPFAEAAQVVENARHELSTQVEADPRYTERLDLWSQCLLAKGHPRFADPVEAMRSVTLDPASATSIQLALSDYACQREVGLAESAQAILSELSREWLNQNPGAIAALNAALDALVGSAQALLDSAAGS